MRALSETQQNLTAILQAVVPDPRPVFARDGSLTFFDDSGKWWRGCSVPVRAAESMLAALNVKGRVACLLAPTLAAHVRVALSRSRTDQAIIAVTPDLPDLSVLLRCDNFSADLTAHRVWFAWGEDWMTRLRELLAERPGLATPAQFIRLPTTPGDDVDRMVGAAQIVFAETNTARADRIELRRTAWRRRPPGRLRLYVIAPSLFRLWDDAGAVLADAIAATPDAAHDASVTAFDPDDPARSSVVALSETTEVCDAIIAADTSRTDLPGVVPAAMPWITWVTRREFVPSFGAAGESDALVVCDPALREAAVSGGWPSERIALGGWPALPGEDVAPADSAPPALAIVADTRQVEMPEALSEFSSHTLLWNAIADELAADPFVMGGGAASYLETRMARHGVSPDGFDTGLFLDRLILPSYAQSVARVLREEGLPTRLFGAGWDAIDEFHDGTAGPVTSRHDLAAVRRVASAVVDVSTDIHRHPLHRLGLPVLSPAETRGRRGLVGAGRAMLSGRRIAPPAASPVRLNHFLRLLRA